MENKLGTDVLINIAVEVITTATTVTNALKDGFQFTDLAALLSVAPAIQDVTKTGRTAIAQLLDLTPEEAEAVAVAIAQRTGNPSAGILAKVNAGFTLLARTYRKVKDIQYLALDWQTFAKTLAA